jgi:hypothetical protein
MKSLARTVAVHYGWARPLRPTPGSSVAFFDLEEVGDANKIELNLWGIRLFFNTNSYITFKLGMEK